jgi:hypothetical protein
MAQNIINYGESPNDGEGDSLRTAFIKTDDNFDQIWATGPVGSNVTILNNTIGVVNTNGNLILSPNGIGVIQTNSKLVPRIPNTYDLGSPNLRYRSAYIGTGGLDVSGNIVIAGGLELDGDVVIDGNLTVNGNDTYINMANLVSINVGSNANVNWQFNQTGNLTLPNIANPSINYANGEPYVSTGSGGVTQSDAAPAGPTPSTLWWDEVSGRLYVYYTDADGSQWVDASPAATGSTYGNANVAAYLTTYTGNLAAGNLTVSSGSDLWTMSGQFLTGPGGAYWHSHPEQSTDEFVSAPGSDITIKSIDANSVLASQISLTGIDIEIIVVNGVTKTWRFTESGTSEIPGDIVPILPLGATANVGNITNPWDNAYISGNIESGNVSAVGNITANYFIGNGSLLTGLASSYGNADVAANLAAFGSNPISTTGSITSSSLSAINLVINSITSDDSSFVNINDGVNVNGEILATGNITGNYFIGNGSQLTGLSGNIANITANVITFNTNAGISVGAGQMAWNSADGTLDLGLSYADVVLQVGQETHYVVRNDTGNIIQNGTAVYCSGVAGGSGRIEASPMMGNIDPVQFLGLATQDISNGVNGVVTYFGYVRGLDTRGTANTAISVGDETWSVGDKLYVHPTAPGKLTKVEPEAPNVKICVASIMIRNQTAGVLFVRPTSNLDLVDLSDVQVTTPAVNEFLVYAGNRWQNTALDISVDTTPTLGGNLAGAGFDISNVGNISATGNVTGNTAGFAIGYRDIPQVSFTGNATIATTDAGKHYYSTLSTGNVLTIANNASQGFQIGAAITVVNQGTGTITIAQGSGVTLYLAGNATSGNRSVSTFGMATIIKVATDTWFINGTGVS